jgi:hypothetical protein
MPQNSPVWRRLCFARVRGASRHFNLRRVLACAAAGGAPTACRGQPRRRETLRVGGDFNRASELVLGRIFVTTGTASEGVNLCATGDVSDCVKIVCARSSWPNYRDDRVGVAGRFRRPHEGGRHKTSGEPERTYSDQRLIRTGSKCTHLAYPYSQTRKTHWQ